MRGLRDAATIELANPCVKAPAGERAARLLDPTVFYALLALTVLTAIPYGAGQPWWMAIFECTIFVLTALWIIEGLRGGAWSVSEHRLLTPLVALVAFAFVQTLPLWGAWAEAAGITFGSRREISADPFETRRFILQLLALTLAAALLLRYTSTRRRLRMLVYIVIGVGVASALFAIVRGMAQDGAHSFVLPRLQPGQGYGQFINRNHFALLMEMALGLVLGLIVGGGVRRDRLLIHLSAALLMWAALVLSNSRGGIFSMLCQLLFLAFVFVIVRSGRESSEYQGDVHRLRRLQDSLIVRSALIACLLITVIVGVLWIGGEPLANRLESLPEEIGAEGRLNVSRWDMWRATWPLIEAHPLFGVGFGGYYVAITKYHDASGEMRPWPAHNEYLDLLACGGVFGFSLGAWFFVAFIKRARGGLRSKDRFRHAACLGALTGLSGVAVHSLVDFGLHITVNALVCTSLVVIATVSMSNPEH